MTAFFRPEVIEAKRRRLWGDVQLSQPPSLTVWCLVLAGLCLCLLLGLTFGTFTRKETVAGFLVPSAGVVQVHALQTGRVSRILVEEGATVVAGQALIEFSSDIASVGGTPVADMQLVELERQIDALAAREDAVQKGFAVERSRLLEQIRAQERMKAILASQRSVQADALALSEADVNRLVQLQDRGFAPAVEVDRRRRNVMAERSSLAELDSRLAEVEAGVVRLQSEAAAIPAREAEALATIASDRATLLQRRGDLQVARGYVLKAPVAGVVSNLQARLGMSPSSSSPLLSISPADSPLEAHLLVPTRAIGFLEPGQVARLQIDAFPFQRFGFVEGTIKSVSKTVTRPGDAAYPMEQTETVYEVRVALDRNFVDAYGDRKTLLPGMILRADIPIDRRRLYQQLFDPLIAARKRAA